jgi:hypothetical protein
MTMAAASLGFEIGNAINQGLCAASEGVPANPLP